MNDQLPTRQCPESSEGNTVRNMYAKRNKICAQNWKVDHRNTAGLTCNLNSVNYLVLWNLCFICGIPAASMENRNPTRSTASIVIIPQNLQWRRILVSVVHACGFY